MYQTFQFWHPRCTLYATNIVTVTAAPAYQIPAPAQLIETPLRRWRLESKHSGGALAVCMALTHRPSSRNHHRHYHHHDSVLPTRARRRFLILIFSWWKSIVTSARVAYRLRAVILLTREKECVCVPLAKKNYTPSHTFAHISRKFRSFCATAADVKIAYQSPPN